MQRPMGIMASYINVVFKKDGTEIARTQGSLGCIRHGEPEDTITLLRQAMGDIKAQMDEGRVSKTVLEDYTSVAIGNNPDQARELTRLAAERLLNSGGYSSHSRKGPRF